VRSGLRPGLALRLAKHSVEPWPRPRSLATLPASRQRRLRSSSSPDPSSNGPFELTPGPHCRDCTCYRLARESAARSRLASSTRSSPRIAHGLIIARHQVLRIAQMMDLLATYMNIASSNKQCGAPAHDQRFWGTRVCGRGLLVYEVLCF
jgi:hypothetical protein